MALLRRDYKYEDAAELLVKLKAGDYLPTKEDIELILYYIEHDKGYIKQLQDRLSEYSNFFQQLDRFLPNHNPTLG
jgi:hypothetical protein